MTDRYWLWALVGLALVIVLADVVRGGDWLYLGVMIAIIVGLSVSGRIALPRGYEWHFNRAAAVMMILFMAIVFFVGPAFVGNRDAVALIAFGSASVAFVALSVKRTG